MKRFLSSIPGWMMYLFLVFIFLLAVFSSFRYALLQAGSGDAAFPEEMLNAALSLGISYDTMVASYLLVIPALIFFAGMFFRLNPVWIRRIVLFYFGVLMAAVFLACSADIPYYLFTHSRLNNAIVMWTDTPGAMAGFVLGSSEFYPYLFVFISGAFLSIFLLRFLQKRLVNNNAEPYRAGKKTIFFLLVTFLLLVGIRGGWRVRPIAVRDAFVTNYPFINMLAINPLFSFFDSMAKINVDYFDDETALANVRKYMGVKEEAGSPIARTYAYADSIPPSKLNIVVVLMESMTAEMTGLADGKSFTPNLDSIADKSISFTRFYTCGMHTCNGLYGTLYSLPSVPGMHPLSNVFTANQNFYGMASVLKEHGYSTHFFCTHFEEFDNMGFFLRNNGFDNFFSAKEYDSDLNEGMFGVSDETQYEFTRKKLNELAASGRPFFASLLTISTHEPATMPAKTSYRPASRLPFEQVYEYADWALGNFMRSCAKEPWFSNTVFVFLADHGCNMPGPYELPLSYHHSPFIIYAPALIKAPLKVDKLAIQTDVFPTLMGLLKLPYLNNTLGIDLFREERPFAYFCKDYLVGCLDKEKFLIIRKFGGESMHEYTKGSAENVLEKNLALADSMKAYAYSMFQTAQWMLENKRLGDPRGKQYNKN